MNTRYFETVPISNVVEANSKNSRESGEPTGHARGIHQRHRRRVLVVDDERVIADTLAAILNESGFLARTAYCAEEALGLIDTNVPDLLITDVSMPGMNGIELAIKIRRQYPTCKILLFSGHAATAGLFDEAKNQGYDFQLLSKPVHPRDLLEHLRQVA